MAEGMSKGVVMPVQSPDRDYIRMRRRDNHQGTPVAGGRTRVPFSIPVQHLSWHDDGACRYVDPELFFPDGTADPRAIAICEACPVKQTCLEDALADPRRMGIWGGTTNSDRDRMRGTGRAVYQAEYNAKRRAEQAAPKVAEQGPDGTYDVTA